MPPSTGALLETHNTGLNILLALAHNTSTTGRSHENIVQQWDFFRQERSTIITSYTKILSMMSMAMFFFFFCDTIKKLLWNLQRSFRNSWLNHLIPFFYASMSF